VLVGSDSIEMMLPRYWLRGLIREAETNYISGVGKSVTVRVFYKVYLSSSLLVIPTSLQGGEKKGGKEGGVGGGGGGGGEEGGEEGGVRLHVDI
jgi:hypothetical protein